MLSAFLRQILEETGAIFLAAFLPLECRYVSLVLYFVLPEELIARDSLSRA